MLRSVRRAHHVCRKARVLHRPVCFLEPAMSATLSKIVSNTLTYPIESVRLISMVPKDQREKDPSLRLHVGNLYRGYPQYLPYSVFNYVVTYQVMFFFMNMFHTITRYEFTLATASVFTCLVTAMYKVPCMYFFKNKVINQTICTRTLFTRKFFGKAYGILLLEDIPEMIIKFYLNHFLHSFFPNVHDLLQALMIGTISTMLLTPIDILKNTVLCNLPRPQNPTVIYMRVVCSIMNTTLFFLLFNALAGAGHVIA